MKVVNFTKSIFTYTYNIAPRAYRAYHTSKEKDIELSKEKNLGKFQTFLTKNKVIAKTLFDGINPLEIPIILSAVALPTTPMGGSPAAFVLGCIIATPIVLKKMAKGELSFNKVKRSFSNMFKKDYIKLDSGIRDKLNKIKKNKACSQSLINNLH